MTQKIKNDIESLEFPHTIRTRPVMYMGDVADSTHALVEAVDNIADLVFKDPSVTKAFIKSAKKAGEYFIVANDGSPFPVKWVLKDKRTMMHIACDKPHSGSNFKGVANSIGQNGIGIKGTNALSKEFILVTKLNKDSLIDSCPLVMKEGKVGLFFGIRYEQGILKEEFICSFKELTEKFPKIHFPENYTTYLISYPDPDIYLNPVAKVDKSRISTSIMIFAKFFKRNIVYNVDGELLKPNQVGFKYSVMHNFTMPGLDENNRFSDAVPEVTASILVNWEFDTDLSGKTVVSKGNVNTRNVPRGIHVDKSRKAIGLALKNHFKITHNYLENGIKSEILLLGPGSHMSLRGQTKDSLITIRGLLESKWNDLERKIRKVIAKHETEIEDHVRRLTDYALAMDSLSSKTYVESMVNMKKRLRPITSLTKLRSDAYSKDREKCTLYIVEGESAGGNIVKAKSNAYESVFTIRGYFRNTIGLSLEQMFKNEEANQLFEAIGSGVDAYHVMDNLRYGKIVILADADPDGKAIENLLVSFFCEHLSYLVKAGKVFINDSPLYEQNGKYYRADDKHLLDTNKKFRRFKGIGEFNVPDVRECILVDGEQTRLVQVSMEQWESARSLLVSQDQAKKHLLKEHNLIT